TPPCEPISSRSVTGAELARGVFVSCCSLLGVRLLLFVLGDEQAAAPPPAEIPLHAWAFEEGGSTASRWTPLPRPADKSGRAAPRIPGSPPRSRHRGRLRYPRSRRRVTPSPPCARRCTGRARRRR